MAKGWKFTPEQKERLRVAHLGQVAWNKGMKGFRHSASFKKGHTDLVPYESRIKAGKKLTDEKHPAWKGNSVAYSALHTWIKRKLGRPLFCKHCGKSNIKKGRSVLQWANVSGEYKRALDDWMSLCIFCHRKFDNHPFLKPRSNEEKLKMSERSKGINNPFFGKKHSLESRVKISKALTGKKYAKKSN